MDIKSPNPLAARGGAEKKERPATRLISYNSSRPHECVMAGFINNEPAEFRYRVLANGKFDWAAGKIGERIVEGDEARTVLDTYERGLTHCQSKGEAEFHFQYHYGENLPVWKIEGREQTRPLSE